ncbi:MAG: DHHA1 domain-containing protein [Methanoregulaceae archaeon]|nr:DHHA1 domain-containing protein [Methanoregulaceae archaeon]
MSLEHAAGRIAERMRDLNYVELYAHDDADGVAAGAIIALALKREGKRFRLRIVRTLAPGDLAGTGGKEPAVLCDIGAAIKDLPGETLVIDHHKPRFDGEFHFNPCLEGIDGEKDLSGAGAAYLVASALGDNRDLAGLVMPGIIGDRQLIAGENLRIFNDAVAEGIISTERGLRLPGRDVRERLLMAINPYFDGVSGNETAVEAIIEESGGIEAIRTGEVVSLVILKAAGCASASALEAFYGDTYQLDREVLPDAHSLTALIDACGKTGRGGLAASICLRSTEALPAAWEITRKFRLGVIASIREAVSSGDGPYRVDEIDLVSDVADALAWDCAREKPVLVYAEEQELCRVSARRPPGLEIHIGDLLHRLASEAGGTGGGHPGRGGATIPKTMFQQFSESWREAVA